MNVAKIILKRNVDRIATNVWKNVNEQTIDAISERFDTNFDAKFEKNENFDEMTRFDVKNDENIEIEKIKLNEKIIDWENKKNEINDKIFDCNANFKLSIEKNIDCENVKENEINKFETTNFDFFV